MAARDSRRDCRIGSSLSLRERDLGVRVQSLLNPDAEVEDIPTLTPALSRRERVVYAGCFRLMPMPPAPLRDLRFPIISRGVRKLVDRAGFGMGDDPCSRDDGPCNGEGICPHPRPLSRRERGEKVQVITGISAPLPAGEGLRGEGHPSPPWHWLIAF